jgi:hypothetical protein
MRHARPLLASLIVFALMAGCATRPKVDWNARVGNYTYNRAVVDLGVPDKREKLGDGTLVAEWITTSDSPDYFWGNSFTSSPGWGGPLWAEPAIGWSYPVGPMGSAWLRLVFAPDGKLQSWHRYNR